MGVDATPDTSAGLKRSAWKEPTVQAEFRSWAGMLGVPEPELEEKLWTFAVGWNDARRILIKPFHFYLSWAQCTQSWQMFVAPHTTPSRLQIQERLSADAVEASGLVGGDTVGGDTVGGDTQRWSTLFEERDPERAWLAPAFDVERMRASVFRWSWPSYEPSWKRACKALAQVRFDESDTTTAVRCRFWQARTPSPEQVIAGDLPEGKWVRPVVVERPK